MAIYNTPQPWREQFLFNSSQTAALSSWTTVSSALLAPRWGATAVVAKGFVFVFQGLDSDDTPLASILRAPIGADGVIGTFVNIGSVPNTVTAPARYGAQAILLNDVVYILGGTDGSTGLSTTSVISCPIDGSGALGTWANGNSLAVAVSNFSVCCVANTLYAILGATPAGIQKASVVPGDGSIGTWSVYEATAPPLQGLGESCVLGDNVYFIGGFDFFGSKSAAIYKATVDGAGVLSAFSEYGVSLPVALSGHQVVTAEGKLYVIGGNGAATVYQATVDASGGIGVFSACPSLPGNRYASPAVVTSSRVYLLGGRQTPWEGYYSSTLYTAFIGGLNDYTGYDSEEELLYGTAIIQEVIDDVAGSGLTYNVGRVLVEEPLDELEPLGSSGAVLTTVEESADDVSASGWSAIASSGVVSEALDEAAAVGYSPAVGLIAISEEADLISLASFSGATTTECRVTVEEPLDKVSSVGVNTADRIALTEGADEVSAAASTSNAARIKILEYRDEITVPAASGETRGPLTVGEPLDSVATSAYTGNVGRVVTSCEVDGVAIATEGATQTGSAVVSVTDPMDSVAAQVMTYIGAIARIEAPLDGILLRAMPGAYGAVVLDEPGDYVKLLSRAATGGMPVFEFTRPVADMDSELSAPGPATILHFNRTVPALRALADAPDAVLLQFSR